MNDRLIANIHSKPRHTGGECDTMPPLDDSDKTAVVDLFQKHIPSDMMNVTERDDSVMVQVHDMPNGFGQLLTDLHDHSFSFEVHSAWECPPKIHVTTRDYFESH